ncbi:hypothetical protein RN001_009029 [Aquatica leii]|uniref:Uncharacterized protein n=1 Tax=Aquatica leii TaxID=1421715 RepID=A0AAN7SMP2_9COLE|nr:hypothetical protein RN001_009029 [Aquatica leii]
MSVTLTNEQFKELLSHLTVASAPPQGDSVVRGLCGSFAKCNSRFNGSSDIDVNAFTDAIQIYKDCTGISDDNALKGLPMLLDGFAATWYQGVKSTLDTWENAIDLLKSTFGPAKPPYRVYRELFTQEQDLKTKTDVFICKARSILAQLPTDTLTEATQIDMVYGLLNYKIREKIPRDAVTTFQQLLAKARLAEETLILRLT